MSDNTYKNIKDQNVKKMIAQVLELPKELVLDLPHISMVGKEEIIIQNHNGILEYAEDVIRIKTKLGIVIISGRDLVISKITNEYIQASGKIKGIEYS